MDRKTARYQAPYMAGSALLTFAWAFAFYPDVGATHWYIVSLMILGTLQVCESFHLLWLIVRPTKAYTAKVVTDLSWLDRLKLRFYRASVGDCAGTHGTLTHLTVLEANRRAMHGDDTLMNVSESYRIEAITCPWCNKK